VGCLLHPGKNRGVDLRFRVDFGEKCRREVCPEAETFSQLAGHEREFWLHLADGLDSFSYAGRTTNPLLTMMGWGKDLLKKIAAAEEDNIFTRHSFFESYPFFSTALLPRAGAYIANRVITARTIHLLRDVCFRSAFETFFERISGLLRHETPGSSSMTYVHRLDFDQDFLDFLRLSAGIRRAAYEDVSRLKKIADDQLNQFQKSLL